MTRYIVAIIILLLSAASEVSFAASPRLEKTKIYFINWNIMSRTRLGESEVRRMRHVYVEINSSEMTQSVHEALQNLECSDSGADEPLDVRLVIDLIDKNGKVSSYYGNRDFMTSKSSKKLCKTSTDLLRKLVPIQP